MSSKATNTPGAFLRAPAQTMSRKELFAWIWTALLANYAVCILRSDSLEAFVTSLLLINAIVILAWFVVFKRFAASSANARVTSADVIFAAAFALLFCATTLFETRRFAVGLLATFAGLYTVMKSDGDNDLKASGAVLLALAANMTWAPIVFQYFGPDLVKADAALVGNILSKTNPAILWTDTTFRGAEGHRMILVGACSSFHNMSFGLLACISIAMFARNTFVWRDAVVVLIGSIVMVALNAIRLSVLATSAPAYAYWHDGAGAEIHSAIATVCIIVVGLWGTAWASNTR
jgi:hypothetical protein